MKKIIALQLLIGIIITSVGNFSFAEDQQAIDQQTAYCKTVSVCGTAPEYFTLLLDFVREMMNSIKTIGTEGNYVGNYVSPNRFKGNVFTPPTQNVVGKLERSIAQKLKFGMASTAIFSSPVNVAGLKDMLGGVVLLSKNKAFLRDNKLLEELESQLSDKKYELGLGGGRYEKIIPENRVLMQAIIKKYVDKGLLVDGSLADGVLYNNVTALLTTILSSAKSILYLDEISQFDKTTKALLNDNISVTFNIQNIRTIKNEYICARGPYNVCSTESKKFNANISTIKASLSGGVASAKKTFTDAVKRLGQIFSKNQEKDFTTREAELLKSMYGTTKVTTGLLFGNPGKITTDAGKQVSDLGTDVSKFRQFPKGTQDTAKTIVDTKTSENILATTTPTQGEDTFKEYLKSYVQDVFDQQATDAELAALADVKEVTPAFNVLGQQILTIKTKILGGKDQEGSLIKSLGEACELQCGGEGLCR